MQHIDLPNKDGLIPFLNQAPAMDLATRLKHFDALFPYAEHLPGSIFLLDPESVTLACNTHAWQQVKLDHVTDLVGYNTSEIEQKLGWPTELVGRAVAHDKKVLREALSIHQETIIVGDLKNILLCKKEAIYDDNGKPLGILGFSLPIQTINQKIHWNKEKDDITIILNDDHSVRLSVREFSILQEIVNGQSSVDIAKKYAISSKTVETYVMRVKCKFHCEKQREIVPILIKHNLAQAILEYKIS